MLFKCTPLVLLKMSTFLSDTRFERSSLGRVSRKKKINS